MKILNSKIIAVRVDFEGVMPGFHIALRLQTDDAIEGISYVSRVTDATARPLAQLIASMVASVAGADPLAVEALHARLCKGQLGAPLSGLELRAASAIDVALWDIRGKALGQPVYRLMGGFRDRMPVSANWGLMPGPAPDKVAAHIEKLIARGFKALKCPVGLAPIDAAIAHVKHVRRCAGRDIEIIVDGNFQWTLKDALRFARETQECDLFWIEDPVAAADYAAMAQFTATVRQRTCAGEAFQHLHEFRWLMERRCSDIVMIDQDLGLTGFVKAAHMAQAHGLSVVNHLAPETLSHALAAVPNGLIVGLVPWGQPLFTEPMKIEAGNLVMPNKPGLGLDFDEDVLKSCAVA
jgi:L-alanine-DL-glutamate epimerase-like enolase superfamily enzyme